jgi:hypothetical protein
MGLSVMVSAGALNVAIFISLSRFDHHDGMRPQRIGDSSRLPSRWAALSKQVELALFFDTRLHLATP